MLLALSGGVDSSVCAALLAVAVGKLRTCVFVDKGFGERRGGRGLSRLLPNGLDFVV